MKILRVSFMAIFPLVLVLSCLAGIDTYIADGDDGNPVSIAVNIGEVDGYANDEIQEAIDSLPGGGIVQLDAALYITNEAIVLKDDITIQGMGSGIIGDTHGVTTLQPADGSSHSVITGPSSGYVSNIHVRDLAIFGNKSNVNGGYLIDLTHLHQPKLTNVYGNRGYAGGIYCDSSVEGVEELQAIQVVIDNCNGDQWNLRMSLCNLTGCAATHTSANGAGFRLRGNMISLSDSWVDCGSSSSGYGVILDRLTNSIVSNIRIYKTEHAGLTVFRTCENVTISDVLVYYGRRRAFVIQPDGPAYGPVDGIIMTGCQTVDIQEVAGVQESLTFLGEGTVQNLIIENNNLPYDIEYGSVIRN